MKKQFLFSYVSCPKQKALVEGYPKYMLIYAKNEDEALKLLKKHLGAPLFMCEWIITCRTIL